MAPHDHPAPQARPWFGRSTTTVAWAVLLIALVHPPHGLNVPLCWMASTTGVPCPGCGLTRSVSCAVRGMLEASWEYHPFGILFAMGFGCVALVSLLPTAPRRRLALIACRHARVANTLYALLVGAFLTYGAARAAAHLLHPK